MVNQVDINGLFTCDDNGVFGGVEIARSRSNISPNWHSAPLSPYERITSVVSECRCLNRSLTAVTDQLAGKSCSRNVGSGVKPCQCLSVCKHLDQKPLTVSYATPPRSKLRDRSFGTSGRQAASLPSWRWFWHRFHCSYALSPEMSPPAPA